MSWVKDSSRDIFEKRKFNNTITKRNKPSVPGFQFGLVIRVGPGSGVATSAIPHGFLAARSRHPILCRDTTEVGPSWSWVVTPFLGRNKGARQVGRVWVTTETISLVTRIEWPQVTTWEVASQHGRERAELTLGRDIDLRSRHGLAGWCVVTLI